MLRPVSSSASAVAIAAALLVSCAESTGRRPGDIIGGVLDEGDPAVVALLRGGQSYCTGTLIAPTVILTAAHCVVEEGVLVPPDAIFLGTAVDQEGEIVPVAWVESHPAWHESSFFGDAALVGLVAPAQSAAPVPIRRAAISPNDLYAPLRFVGFGALEEGGGGMGGTKFEGQAPLDHVDPEFVLYGQVTCNGDSGGPAFLDNGTGVEEVAGVTSHGPRYCFEFGPSFSLRVDAIAGWIDTRLAATATGCALDGRCFAGCAADPDCTCVADGQCDTCPGREDVDCSLADVGDACNATAACQSGSFCVNSVCARACDPERGGACRSTERCAADEPEGRSVCLPLEAETPETGCDVAPGTRPRGFELAMFALLLLAIAWARRAR